jgi:ATP dependent DNA ligase domain
MRSTLFEFCLPTRATAVQSGPDWLHEVKCDGYRLRIERDGDRVRLYSRNGYDWSSRYPWIVEAARQIRQTRFVLDGEAVILGVDGIADSMPSIVANMTRRCSSVPSTSSWRARTISGSSRCTCARQASSGC